MGRDRFLRLAKEFNDNYIVSNEALIDLVENEKQPNETNKEYLMKINHAKYTYSQLNYKKLVSITNIPHTDKRETPKNPFENFYHLSNHTLHHFFIFLHTTDLFLHYHSKYEFDKLRDYDSKIALANKYVDVIADLEAQKMEFSLSPIKILEDRKDSLLSQTTFPTMRNIFEDFLHSIHVLLVGRREGATLNLTEKNANITNLIIEHYFGKEVTFSKNVKFDSFHRHSYAIESNHRISLLHRRTSR